MTTSIICRYLVVFVGFLLLDMSSACDNQGVLVNNMPIIDGGTLYVQANEFFTVECKCKSSGTPKWTDPSGRDVPNCSSSSSDEICYSDDDDDDSSSLRRIFLLNSDKRTYICSGVSITVVAQVISEPDDVTVCEGEGAVFACVLNDTNIKTNNDVQWYRFIKDSNTREEVNQQGGNIMISFPTYTTSNMLTSSLTITNAIKSYTGYYWVRLPSDDVCNVSLTVIKRPSTFMKVNITKIISSSSVAVQWDTVDSLNTTYVITWTDDGTNTTQSHTLIDQSSYTITGLTLDTVYTITVTVDNRCGAGPEYRTTVAFYEDVTSTTAATTTDVAATTTATTTTDTIAATTTTANTPSTAVLATITAIAPTAAATPMAADAATTTTTTTTTAISPTITTVATTTVVTPATTSTTTIATIRDATTTTTTTTTTGTITVTTPTATTTATGVVATVTTITSTTPTTTTPTPTTTPITTAIVISSSSTVSTTTSTITRITTIAITATDTTTITATTKADIPSSTPTTDVTNPSVNQCKSNDNNDTNITSSEITTAVLGVLFIISLLFNIIIMIWINKIPQKFLQFKAKLRTKNHTIQASNLEPLYEVIVLPDDNRMENPTYTTQSIKIEKNPAYSIINTHESLVHSHSDIIATQ